MLSMQSRTKSGFPERTSSSDDESYSSTFASTWHSGNILKKCFFRQRALEVPTSSLVATACLFNDETETYKIMNKSKFFRHWINFPAKQTKYP